MWVMSNLNVSDVLFTFCANKLWTLISIDNFLSLLCHLNSPLKPLYSEPKSLEQRQQKLCANVPKTKNPKKDQQDTLEEGTSID